MENILRESLDEVFGDGVGKETDILFETPREEKFGDLSTSVAMRLARARRENPRKIAEALCKALETRRTHLGLGARIEKIQVEGAGFINFYFTREELAQVILKIKNEAEAFGKPHLTQKKKILLEFVSANPTGPLTVAHGRQAALGDSLARILRFCGHHVTTEYYNNDEGVQIETLGKSLHLWMRRKLLNENVEFPENYYRGAYLEETADHLIQKEGRRFLSLGPREQEALCQSFAKEDIMKGIEKDLADFDVSFDGFYSQCDLGRSGKVEKTLETLKKEGVVFESEGAVWFRSTAFGDDKDRVLVKSDNTYTYLTPDIAYHHEKFGRGFEMLIDIWGPDHHGYIPRLVASQKALGHDATAVKILIAQLVTLYEGKKQVRMSTRAGEFVTLRQILDEVGRDAGRFFFLMRKFDAHLDFDLELAKTQTPDNPVFYIQYAHARIESVQAACREKGFKFSWENTDCLSRLDGELDARLLRLLAQFEESVSAAETTLEPFRLVPYLMDLAATYHRFYTENRILTEDEPLSKARLMLSIVTQQVLRNGLGLLGVSAPMKM